jgi:hypothetical protein
MAHDCPECGSRCHCGGDIDDLVFNDTQYEARCTCCDWLEDEEKFYDNCEYNDDALLCYLCGLVHRDGDCIAQGADE